MEILDHDWKMRWVEKSGVLGCHNSFIRILCPRWCSRLAAAAAAAASRLSGGHKSNEDLLLWYPDSHLSLSLWLWTWLAWLCLLWLSFYLFSLSLSLCLSVFCLRQSVERMIRIGKKGEKRSNEGDLRPFNDDWYQQKDLTHLSNRSTSSSALRNKAAKQVHCIITYHRKSALMLFAREVMLKGGG